jgi:hypothetical protein
MSGQQQDNLSMKQSFNGVIFLSDLHAVVLECFLHHSMGDERPGMRGLMGGGLLLFWAGFSQDPLMVQFLGLWIVALVFQRACKLRLWWRGQRAHSRYTGRPWLMSVCPIFRNELLVKGFLEPMLCLCVGSALYQVSEHLGTFIMLGCFTLFLSIAMERQLNAARVRHALDAQLEVQWHAERIRGQRQDF